MDLLILATICIFALVMFIWGYTNGFIRIVFTLAITIVMFLASMFLADPLEKFLKNNTETYEYIEKRTSAYVDKHVPKEVDISSTQIQNDTIKELELPKVIKDKLIKNNTDDVKLSMGSENFRDYLSKYLADTLLHCLAVIILFIGLKVLAKILVVVLHIISRLPVINGVNKMLGGVLGIADAVLIIWVACIVITACSSTQFGARMLIEISNNEILEFIYNNNPLFLLINI